MTIETKFDVGSAVYFIYENKIMRRNIVKVTGVKGVMTTSVYYWFNGIGESIAEDCVFGSISKLIKKSINSELEMPF